MNDNRQKLRDKLTALEYHVTQEKGTERPFTGDYWNHWEAGDYVCKVCNKALFSADSKFDARCGWPSFDKPLENTLIDEYEDRSLARVRTEVTCSNCQSHLGHVFNDGPTETGLRYCINSASITHTEHTK